MASMRFSYMALKGSSLSMIAKRRDRSDPPRISAFTAEDMAELRSGETDACSAEDILDMVRSAIETSDRRRGVI